MNNLNLIMRKHQFSSVHSNCSVMSNSLRPHESQHAKPLCPSPIPGVYPKSYPLSQGNIRQTQTEGRFTNTQTILFKSDKVLKGKERLRNSSRLKVTKETWQVIVGCDSKELDIRNIFGMYWLKTEIRIRWSKCININFLFVFKFVLWLYRKITWF